jgi:chromatin segregation and condensation protein Rec8/ScpA/Scc1 (kleisin family)
MPPNIRRTMHMAKMKHWTMKQEQANDNENWINTREERNELRNKYSRKIAAWKRRERAQARIEQISANPTTAWEQVGRYKRAMRSRTNPQPLLTDQQENSFIHFWRSLYEG